MADKHPMPTVVGRITALPDGGRALEPLHAATVLAYQRRVAELLAAARAYTLIPSVDTLTALKQAAHNLDR